MTNRKSYHHTMQLTIFTVLAFVAGTEAVLICCLPQSANGVCPDIEVFKRAQGIGNDIEDSGC